MSDDPYVVGGNPFGLSNTDMMGMFSGLGLISSGLAGYNQYRSGQAQKAAYDYNAQAVLDDIQQKEADTASKFSAIIGRQSSLYAKAGVDISSGSPLLMSVMTAMTGAREETRIEQAGEEQAALDRYYGKAAAFSGTMGGITSFLQGLSGVGMGLAKMGLSS